MNNNLTIRCFIYLFFIAIIFYLLNVPLGSKINNRKCYLKKRIESNNLSINDKTIKMLIKKSVILESRIGEIEFKLKDSK